MALHNNLQTNKEDVMKKALSAVMKSLIFPLLSCLLFLAEFLLAKNNELELIIIISITSSSTVLPLLYFRLKKGTRYSVLYTISGTITYVISFVCVFRLLKPYFTISNELILTVGYYMHFAILFGILVFDIISMIYRTIKSKIPSEKSKELSHIRSLLCQSTPMLIGVSCVLCIYLLIVGSSGIEKLLLMAFIPSFFSSVYYVFKAAGSSPKHYFYSLLISHLLIGMPILYELINKFYMHFAKNIYLDLYDLRIAVYLSVVFLIIADAVQTFVLDKKNTTNGTIETTA